MNYDGPSLLYLLHYPDLAIAERRPIFGSTLWVNRYGHPMIYDFRLPNTLKTFS